MKQKVQTDFVGCRVSREKKELFERLLNEEQKTMSAFFREKMEQYLKGKGKSNGEQKNINCI